MIATDRADGAGLNAMQLRHDGRRVSKSVQQQRFQVRSRRRRTAAPVHLQHHEERRCVGRVAGRTASSGDLVERLSKRTLVFGIGFRRAGGECHRRAFGGQSLRDRLSHPRLKPVTGATLPAQAPSRPASVSHPRERLLDFTSMWLSGCEAYRRRGRTSCALRPLSFL
jgi:hypothetical protein